MHCDGEIVNANNHVNLTHKSSRYYFFRCDVFGSIKLIWEISNSSELNVAPFTSTGYILSNDINYLIEKVQVGESESDTNFTSYMWFYSENVTPSFVRCASAEFSTMAFFGNYILWYLHFILA